MTTLDSALESLLLFGIATAALFWIGRRRGFFAPVYPAAYHPPSIFHFLGAFAIYFGVQIPLSKWGYHLVPFVDPILKMGWIMFLLQSVTTLGLLCYLFILPSPIRHDLWLKRGYRAIKSDVLIALGALLIACPAVFFSSTLLELIVYAITHTFELPDQLAIHFFKLTFGYPLPFALAIVSIVFFAPIIEEVLFRGFLQTYCRRYLGANGAIALSSVCFALFHFSLIQGWANLPLLGSLFIIACFLGYIYERQGSLFCSILFHSLFNTINAANLYFLGLE